jgi:hypothetical protein
VTGIPESDQEGADEFVPENGFDFFSGEEAADVALSPERTDVPLISDLVEEGSKPFPELVKIALCDGGFGIESELVEIVKVM